MCGCALASVSPGATITVEKMWRGIICWHSPLLSVGWETFDRWSSVALWLHWSQVQRCKQCSVCFRGSGRCCIDSSAGGADVTATKKKPQKAQSPVKPEYTHGYFVSIHLFYNWKLKMLLNSRCLRGLFTSISSDFSNFIMFAWVLIGKFLTSKWSSMKGPI